MFSTREVSDIYLLEGIITFLLFLRNPSYNEDARCWGVDLNRNWGYFHTSILRAFDNLRGEEELTLNELEEVSESFCLVRRSSHWLN